MKKIIVSSKEANQRVDKYLKKFLNEAPLSFIYKLFRKKDVKINGHWVKDGKMTDGWGDNVCSITAIDLAIKDGITHVCWFNK